MYVSMIFLPPANEVWGKVMFLHPSVSHSVHGGGGSIFSRGMLSLAGGAVLNGGVPRLAGGVSSLAGGAVLSSTPPLRMAEDGTPLWLTSGRYASYWNAFLSKLKTNLSVLVLGLTVGDYNIRLSTIYNSSVKETRHTNN